MSTALKIDSAESGVTSGDFVDIAGERYYAIHNVDKIPPFFISVVSSDDHWLFVSSTGGLSAGRVSPDTALFPYITVDRIHESNLHTGPRTLLRVQSNGADQRWEPFNAQHDGTYAISRHVYKNVLGNKLCFAEVNYDLQLEFRYTWATSDAHGFVRHCELFNHGSQAQTVEILDGLQNILPAGTPRFTQTNSSNLVDAYKWTELEQTSGLAIFALYSGITDRAEPCESLKANVAYCLGFDDPTILISSEQVDRFRRGESLETEAHKRGIRGAFLVNQALELTAKSDRSWQIVANIELSQADVVALRNELAEPAALAAAIGKSVAEGSDELAKIMAMCDGFQATAEENVAVRHYANVLFNVLRGGYFPDHYNVSAQDFRHTIRTFNRPVYQRNRQMLDALPETVEFAELLSKVKSQDDRQLERLCHEYLPITFGRRHGDPSRPWNLFAIRLKDRYGNALLSYEGNWRDIFQNWEALALSYPEFVENMVAKFVNASTMDGYNPYRITKEGIDWEVEDPEDPWSYIGYWGDHQIIYLTKLLEISRDFHPARLGKLLLEPVFAYANVPYRIRSFDKLIKDPKHTVDYDDALAERIEKLLGTTGYDAKLVLDDKGEVLQVTLLEKLLVPLLSKLGNLVVDGGIWMNTQRPEWNDANNALVGQGLSMVTLYYLRRYVSFLQDLLARDGQSVELSGDVAGWLAETAGALASFCPKLDGASVSSEARYELLAELGEAASRFRETVYGSDTLSATETVELDAIRALLADAVTAIDHTIGNNRRDDGLFHAYNLLEASPGNAAIGNLYPMLEGQVAALSAGSIEPRVAVDVLESLFESAVYRADQHTFMLYPDRELPGFLQKNAIAESDVNDIPLLRALVADGNDQVMLRDADGHYRFSAEFANVSDLEAELDALPERYADEVDVSRERLHALFEKTFDHQAFTGRSGTMFGFEGLGCVYWHMVSKLLLAVQEVYFAAGSGGDADAYRQIGRLYYKVRAGLGFNKTPVEFGAFPTDPYSHTPGHIGARQPGMTGQVKEEILTRFGELGIRVRDGKLHFEPTLLRRQEFRDATSTFCWLAVDDSWQDVEIPIGSLAFTLCQVPIVYELNDSGSQSVTIGYTDGTDKTVDSLELPAEDSAALFDRAGRIRHLTVTFGPGLLFAE